MLGAISSSMQAAFHQQLLIHLKGVFGWMNHVLPVTDDSEYSIVHPFGWRNITKPPRIS